MWGEGKLFSSSRGLQGSVAVGTSFGTGSSVKRSARLAMQTERWRRTEPDCYHLKPQPCDASNTGAYYSNQNKTADERGNQVDTALVNVESFSATRWRHWHLVKATRPSRLRVCRFPKENSWRFFCLLLFCFVCLNKVRK